MPRTHPHAEASYRVIAIDDGAFGVEVSIPESCPTTVKAFASEADAEAWIERHRSNVSSQAQTGRWFRRATRSGR